MGTSARRAMPWRLSVCLSGSEWPARWLVGIYFGGRRNLGTLKRHRTRQRLRFSWRGRAGPDRLVPRLPNETKIAIWMQITAGLPQTESRHGQQLHGIDSGQRWGDNCDSNSNSDSVNCCFKLYWNANAKGIFVTWFTIGAPPFGIQMKFFNEGRQVEQGRPAGAVHII